jgi:O-antigen/teichoic acid export membrane protein
MGRNQGVAVIINLFLGTIANAAYGIANQINGALSHFASTFQKAINPQLMKSEGMGNRERLIRISFISSKFSVLAIGLFAVPLIIEMNDVLHVWLKDNIPPYTMQLSCCILFLSIIYQYSMGIMSSIQAAGNIRNYQIVICCLILLNIPLSFVLLKLGFPIYYITIGYIVIEIVSLIVRIFFAKNLVGMEPNVFLKKVFAPTFFVIFVSSLGCLIPHFLLENLWLRLVNTFGLYVFIYLVMMWYFAFDKVQRENVLVKIHLKKK